MPDSRDKRRWWQFSLKAILVLTLAVAAFFGGRASNRQIAKDALRESQDALRDGRNRVFRALREGADRVYKNAILPGKWRRSDTGDVVTFRASGICESESLGVGWWRVSETSLTMRFPDVVTVPPDPLEPRVLSFILFEGVNKFDFFADPAEETGVTFTRIVESTR